MSELAAVAIEHIDSQEDGSGILELPHSKTDQEGEAAFVWLSPETMRRVTLWRDAAEIRAGILFRRVAVTRTKAREARRAFAIRDLAYNAQIDRDRMPSRPAQAASVTYTIGEGARGDPPGHQADRARGSRLGAGRP